LTDGTSRPFLLASDGAAVAGIRVQWQLRRRHLSAVDMNAERRPLSEEPAIGYWRRLLAPFQSKQFRNAWWATAGLQAATAVQLVGATWLMASMTKGPELVAFLISASSAPVLLFSLTAGALADRYQRPVVILVCETLMLLSAVSVLILALFDYVTPAVLVVFIFIWFTGLAFRAPAYQSYLFSSLPAESIEHGVSLANTSFFASRMFGQLLGGLVIAYAGVQTTYAVGVVAAAASVVVFAQLAGARAERREEVYPKLEFARISAFVRSHSVSWAIVLVTLLNFSSSAIFSLTPNLVQDVYRGDSVIYGTLVTIHLVGALVGGLVFAPLSRVLGIYWQSITLSMLGVSLALVAAVDTLRLVALFYFVGGVSAFAVSGALLADVQLRLRAYRELQGRVLSIFFMATFGGVALGGTAWGLIAGKLGISPTFVVAGISAISTGLLAAMLAARASTQTADN